MSVINTKSIFNLFESKHISEVKKRKAFCGGKGDGKKYLSSYLVREFVSQTPFPRYVPKTKRRGGQESVRGMFGKGRKHACSVGERSGPVRVVSFKK